MEDITMPMKNAVFWVVAPCKYCVNRHFGGTYRLHLQGSAMNQRDQVAAFFIVTAVNTSKLT
jgi:hypothetical protein